MCCVHMLCVLCMCMWVGRGPRGRGSPPHSKLLLPARLQYSFIVLPSVSCGSSSHTHIYVRTRVHKCSPTHTYSHTHTHTPTHTYAQGPDVLVKAFLSLVACEPWMTERLRRAKVPGWEANLSHRLP